MKNLKLYVKITLFINDIIIIVISRKLNLNKNLNLHQFSVNLSVYNNIMYSVSSQLKNPLSCLTLSNFYKSISTKPLDNTREAKLLSNLLVTTIMIPYKITMFMLVCMIY